MKTTFTLHHEDPMNIRVLTRYKRDHPPTLFPRASIRKTKQSGNCFTVANSKGALAAYELRKNRLYSIPLTYKEN